MDFHDFGSFSNYAHQYIEGEEPSAYVSWRDGEGKEWLEVIESLPQEAYACMIFEDVELWGKDDMARTISPLDPHGKRIRPFKKGSEPLLELNNIPGICEGKSIERDFPKTRLHILKQLPSENDILINRLLVTYE